MTAPAAGRRLRSWVDSYTEYTGILQSTPLYRKWVAIFTVGAALERRVWCRTMGSTLYPNLYVILVGPPGVGKGQAIYPGESILREVPDMKVGPSDLTAASLIDALHEAVRKLLLRGDPPYVEFNSLTVISRELGVLIPAWDAAFMNNLTDIYDGFTVDQRRRGKDLRIVIKSPQINLLGACTPSYLNSVLPAGAWDQGFLSRALLIYSGQRDQKDPFADEEGLAAFTRVRGDLLSDLKSIASDYGQMQFTKPAVAAIQEWVRVGGKTAPTHMKLQYYNSRRLAHLLKLCMIATASHSNDKIITLENYAEALNWLTEAEDHMPEIFKSMMTGGDSSAMEETWEWIWNVYSKERRPVQEHRIVHFLRERVPAHGVMKVVEIMVRANMMRPSMGSTGFNGYTPTSKEARLTGAVEPPSTPPAAG